MDQMFEVLELVFQIVAVCAWLVALPILVIVLTPCYVVASIGSRGRYWSELKKRYRVFFSKWKDALPIH